ncbi:hypothetical protein [Pedobacter sp. SYP-B3415]|uniref:hypothetical protein n=1 Tax=Pedobacter sp. SYP-B3415 TaxID=2496641 RepID=UPI00101D5711|nr:hypothetical protein [Pedobacter sp. SYP-B3415]
MNALTDQLFNASPHKLARDWSALKKLVGEAVDREDHPEAFRLLKALGYIGYRYNFLDKFVDTEADALILRLTEQIQPPVSAVQVHEDRVVFYDYFLLENRGFTQQYIDQIIKNDVELLFITLADERDLNEDNAIIRTLRGYRKASVYVVPYQLPKAEQVRLMTQEILRFAPSKWFNHNIPYDILPVCVAFALKNTGIRSYFLNISDHAFFLGRDAFDFFIDFRIYGHQLNALLRGIDRSRLLVIPTPPYLTPETYTTFEGFPVETTGKVIGFSGGMVYKIIDKDNTFLHLIKTVLDENPDFLFLFANVFGDSLLRDFIKKHGLENRFILIGNRRDINEVYKRIDIYINTYPFSGSLMMQYAIQHQKPVLSLSDAELVFVRMDKLFDKEWDNKFIITDREKFVRIAGKLINDKQYRDDYARELADGIDTTETFAQKFAALLNNEYRQQPVDLHSFEINTEAVANFHINMDNIFFKEYLYLKNAFFPGQNKLQKAIGTRLPLILLKITGKVKKQTYGPTILRYN